MSVKLIAVDLDGTLLSSEYTISPADAQALKQAAKQGIKIVVTTGRSEAESRIYAHQIGAFQYMITHAGACLYNCEQGQYVSSKALTRPAAYRILEILEEYDDVFFEVYCLNRAYTTHKSYRNFHTCGLRTGFLTVTSPMLQIVSPYHQIATNYDINKFFLCSTNPHSIASLKDKVAQIPGVQVVSSLSTALEFFSPEVDKGLALSALAQKIKVSKEEIMGIGDSENDIGLFMSCGVKVAVENAFDCLKAMADLVVRSHDDSGVSQAVAYAFNQQ